MLYIRNIFSKYKSVVVFLKILTYCPLLLACRNFKYLNIYYCVKDCLGFYLYGVVKSYFYFCFLQAHGPNQCQRCLNDDGDNCTLNQDAQTCDVDRRSLGNTHCGSAVIKYRDLSGKIVNGSHVRGCINCAGKSKSNTLS